MKSNLTNLNENELTNISGGGWDNVISGGVLVAAGVATVLAPEVTIPAALLGSGTWIAGAIQGTAGVAEVISGR